MRRLSPTFFFPYLLVSIWLFTSNFCLVSLCHAHEMSITEKSSAHSCCDGDHKNDQKKSTSAKENCEMCVKTPTTAEKVSFAEHKINFVLPLQFFEKLLTLVIFVPKQIIVDLSSREPFRDKPEQIFIRHSIEPIAPPFA